MSDDPLSLIRGQIKAAKEDLELYPPTDIDWYARCRKTADAVIPWLCQIAPDMLGFCEEVYNSPERVRELWVQCKNEHPIDRRFAEKIDLQLGRQQVLIKEIAGDVVSRVMTDYMLADGVGTGMASNGKSDYPDLYMGEYDYTKLPKFDRKKSKEYGAALKGNKPVKPVRVPDGVEIKTCRNSFRVDCHYNHMGLHVALFYTEKNGQAKMCDLLAAFLRPCDYAITKRNTDATTAKASFNARMFVSLTPGGCVAGAVKGMEAKRSGGTSGILKRDGLK